eukprot:jgi/Hompol1/3605/HPOL_003298-RA
MTAPLRLFSARTVLRSAAAAPPKPATTIVAMQRAALFSSTAVVRSALTLQHKGHSMKVQTGLFINNKFVPSLAGAKFATIDPSNGKIICEVSEGRKEDVETTPFRRFTDSLLHGSMCHDLGVLCGVTMVHSDVAVAAAQRAYDNTWRTVTPSQRGLLLNKLAGLIERDLDSIAALEAWDNGKHFNEARTIDLPMVIANLRYFAGWSDKISGKVVDMDTDHHLFTRHEPYGVVGQIIPWNFPLLMFAWKIGPALAAGNTIVLKTSEKTPLSALKICELIVEAGFPAGVVNVISGFGPTAGNAIASHKDILKVAFTGSTAVGKQIMSAAATSNLKKVSLELGGKSPSLVFADADLDVAVSACKLGVLLNHGQCCCAGTRIFVQEDIHDKFVEKLREAFASVKLGDQFNPGCNHGPLVDKIQFERVMGYIEQGKREGAHVVIGGKRHGHEGYFVEPTIFTNAHDNMKVVREEIFGPVVSVLKFKTVDEAIRRANDSEYGLAAGVFTTSLSTAHRVSSQLQAGTVWVNTYNNINVQAPFGGYKSSGIGRDNSEYALREYTQTKAVYMKL